MFEMALGIAFFLAGVAILGKVVFDSVRGLRARQWPVFKAVVLEKDIKSHKGHRSTYFVPTVRYRYQVDGCMYESNRIMFGYLSTYDHNDAERFISYFEIGEPIPVYVSPVRPQVSVVKPGVNNNVWFWLVWACLAVFMGGELVFKNLK